MSSIDEWQGWLLSPPRYVALRSLPADEAQQVFDEARRRAFGKSVLRSGVVWLILAWVFVPFVVLLLVAFVGQQTEPSKWLIPPPLLWMLVSGSMVPVMLRWSLARQIRRVLAERHS